uniref:Putative secreted mucin n=1 Tax=Amblyomma tuberculatum TaxID=48802 RepID=A0A6M2E4K8_9ACAR
MEIRPFLIACFLAAVEARSIYYGDPRWKCITRAPGDNPGEVHIVEKPDLCIYYCSNDNQTWYFGLYLDKTACKIEDKAGICKEGECVEPEAPGPEVAGPGKEKEGDNEVPEEGAEDESTGGDGSSPNLPAEQPSLPTSEPSPPSPGDLEDLNGDGEGTENGTTPPSGSDVTTEQGAPTPVTGVITEE